MAENLKLPVGIEDFKEIRQENFYYVDKTRLIEQLLNRMCKSEFVYATASFWKNVEYEYASAFF